MFPVRSTEFRSKTAEQEEVSLKKAKKQLKIFTEIQLNAAIR
jgi:hypothetical protein